MYTSEGKIEKKETGGCSRKLTNIYTERTMLNFSRQCSIIYALRYSDQTFKGSSPEYDLYSYSYSSSILIGLW